MKTQKMTLRRNKMTELFKIWIVIQVIIHAALVIVYAIALPISKLLDKY